MYIRTPLIKDGDNCCNVNSRVSVMPFILMMNLQTCSAAFNGNSALCNFVGLIIDFKGIHIEPIKGHAVGSKQFCRFPYCKKSPFTLDSVSSKHDPVYMNSKSGQIHDKYYNRVISRIKVSHYSSESLKITKITGTHYQNFGRFFKNYR